MTDIEQPTKETVIAALREVMDPCSLGMGRPTSIVDLGIVYDVVIAYRVVTVRLVLTDPACFFLRDISRYIQDVIEARFQVQQVRVELVTDRLWIPLVKHVPRSPFKIEGG